MGDTKEKSKLNVAELNIILDRTIKFVENCDSKASIILALFGVLITVVSTSNVAFNIFEIISKLIQTSPSLSCLYMLMGTVAIILIISSIIELLIVISAKVDKSGLDSKIYFKDISENDTCCTYKDKLKKMDKKAYKEDLIAQIYTNAKICTKKYEKYNLAIRLGVAGIILFLSWYLIGIIVF